MEFYLSPKTLTTVQVFGLPMLNITVDRETIGNGALAHSVQRGTSQNWKMSNTSHLRLLYLVSEHKRQAAAGQSPGEKRPEGLFW